MNRESFKIWALLLLVVFISTLFLSMIKQFLMAILLAGIFASLFHPSYKRMLAWLGGRRSLASLATIMLIVCLFLLPLVGLLSVVTAQAIKVGQTVQPWVQKTISEPDVIFDFLSQIPYLDKIEPHRTLIIEKAGTVVASASSFLIGKLSTATFETVNALVMTAIMLYAMFFFLIDGDKLMAKIEEIAEASSSEDKDKVRDYFRVPQNRSRLENQGFARWIIRYGLIIDWKMVC